MTERSENTTNPENSEINTVIDHKQSENNEQHCDESEEHHDNFTDSLMRSFRSGINAGNKSNIFGVASSYFESAKSMASKYTNVAAQYTYTLFTTHPRSKNMTYSQHFMQSFVYFLYSFGATISFLFHSIFPFTFEDKGSDLTCALFNRLCDDGILEVDCDCSDSDSECECDDEIDNKEEKNDSEEQNDNNQNDGEEVAGNDVEENILVDENVIEETN